jgi:hypothetical protein
VIGSESSTLSESELESARRENVLSVAKREVTVGEKVLSVSGESGAIAMVARGEEHKTDEGRGFWLAARARTRLGLSPSDLRLGKAGKACMLVSS